MVQNPLEMRSYLKIISPSLVFICLLSFICNSCINADSSNSADFKVDKVKLKLDTYGRKYTYEGVYSFRYECNKLVYEKDRYGNERTYNKSLGYVDYEISFTSDKLVILNEKKHILEEIILSESFIISEIGEKNTTYEFFPISRRIVNSLTGTVIQTIRVGSDEKSFKNNNLITLTASDYQTSYITGRFFIQDFDGIADLVDDSGDEVTRIITRLKTIPLYEMKYAYNQKVPDYVMKATYSPELLDNFHLLEE